MDKKVRTAISAAGTVSAARKGFLSLRDARKTNDKLLVVNGIASLILTITGGLLTIRELQETVKKRKSVELVDADEH